MSYRPHIADGTNSTITSAISANGSPVYGETYTIPARCGMSVVVRDGELLTVINPHGYQVCDLWAFRLDNLNEYMSMSHSRTHFKKLIPEIGDTLVSNIRNPMLSIQKCDAPTTHDTLIASCDHNRYQGLGVKGYHDNCTDNLRMAAMSVGRKIPLTPDPLNLWMNVPIDSNNNLDFCAPPSKPNSTIQLKSIGDCLIIMSACPQDITPVNGNNKAPSHLEFFVEK